MSVIFGQDGAYYLATYDNEADLEEAILEVQSELFGSERIYLDVKKKIGRRGGKRNIPDGYLIDLSGRRPRLYVVENELASHDPLRHIATQLLEFSLAFEEEPRLVKSVLLEALQSQPDAINQCEEYVSENRFRNLDHFLDDLVHADFAALVVIDEIPERLENILAKRFAFAVEVLYLARYEAENGQALYRFESFLEELSESKSEGSRTSVSRRRRLFDLDEVNTIVVPAREDGFIETFINENRWYAIRIGGIMRPRLKYIAVYRVAPVSAITHIAPVKSIEPWGATDKFVVNFAEPARQIGPINRGQEISHLQNIKYTTLERIQDAKTLDDL